MKKQGREISRAIFEQNLASKIHLPAFADDILILLPPGATFDIAAGMERVQKEIIALLPGDPWKGNDRVKRKGPQSAR